MDHRENRRVNWLAVLGIVVLLSGIAWFMTRTLRLAKDTAQEAHARQSVKALNEAEQKFARLNPVKGFTCDMVDLRNTGWSKPESSAYVFELHCGANSRPPHSTYLVSAYPIDKKARGVWGFPVVCSDQSGRIWRSLSRDEMRTSPTESEMAGKFDFESICNRHQGP
jgi:hypothetical protein